MSAINWIGWLTLVVSVSTAIIVGGRSLSVQLARGIILLTQLRESVELVKVGIQALQLVDTDTANDLKLLEQRVDDLERYLQTQTIVSERPFLIRYGGRRSPVNVE